MMSLEGRIRELQAQNLELRREIDNLRSAFAAIQQIQTYTKCLEREEAKTRFYKGLLEE